MATSSSNSIIEGSQKYPCPTHVNAASFLSIKLSGKSNYAPWRKQMVSLLFSHDMHGFIEGPIEEPEMNSTKYREWKRSDVLVQGWIFGSLSEDVMRTVVDLNAAHEVWNKLEKKYSTPPVRVSTAMTNSKQFDKYIPLCRAIEMGDWVKAQEFFNQDIHALTDKLNKQGNTTLHVAIRSVENIWFLDNLLNKIDPRSLPTMVNGNNLNVLQYAVMFDKHLTVTKLVEKTPLLLFTSSNVYDLPLIIAANGSQRTTFLYLLQACKDHIGLAQTNDCYNPFTGKPGHLLLYYSIKAGFLDVACDLLKDYPDLLAGTEDNYFQDILTILVEKRDGYRSAKNYELFQRFVYTHVPSKNCSLGDTHTTQDIENQDTYRPNIVNRKSYVYTVLERFLVKFWEAGLLHVSHIKRLHEDKVKHITTLSILKYILEKSGKQYENVLIMAVENDILEVVELITRMFPQSIQTIKDYKYTLYELSIMNRCVNVYNFLVHELSHDKDVRRPYSIDDSNNLLHLAGRLAPLEKLNAITSPPLQMQRELQWFQEVSKLICPEEREAKNSDNETPIMVFRKEHENLRQNSEDWIKKTVNSYTVTHALIITITFAAAITVPGGNYENARKAGYRIDQSFIIFMLANALSLVTSTTSLMVFLYLLTARFAHDDFLFKIPNALLIGLGLIYQSMVSMLIAFSAALYITFALENSWFLIAVSVIMCLPVTLVMKLQIPMLSDIMYFTHGREILGKRSKLRKTF